MLNPYMQIAFMYENSYNITNKISI